MAHVTSDQPLSRHTIETPFGDVVVSALGHDDVSFEDVPVAMPELPKKERVDGVHLLKLCLARPVTPDRPLTIRIAVSETMGLRGGANTGDWMEGMNFENEEGVLQFGVRDSIWLGEDGVAASWADYERRHFLQTITSAPAGTAFFASLSWRFFGDKRVFTDSSTWSAVMLTLPDRLPHS